MIGILLLNLFFLILNSTFQPKINNNAVKLSQRPYMMEPICEILYKDANDRANKEKQSARDVS